MTSFGREREWDGVGRQLVNLNVERVVQLYSGWFDKFHFKICLCVY